MTYFRIVAVIVLSALAIALAGPDLSRPFGRPLGDYGYQTDGRSITAVAPGGPAAKAGLHVGDIVSFAGNPHRLEALEAVSSAPGGRLRVRVIAPGARSVVLVSMAEPTTGFPYLVLRNALYILTVLIAGLLLLLRPSAATWALFIFSMHGMNFADAVPIEWLSFSPLIEYGPLFLASASNIALVAFALSLAGKTFERADYVLLALAVILSAVMYVPNVPGLVFSVGIDPLYYGVVIVALVRAYRRAKHEQRAGLQWIAASVAILCLCAALDVSLYPAYLPYPAHALLSVARVLIFASASYALLANRIVDVNFVASRALVYAMLTSITVGVLALVDWFVAKQLDAVRLGLFFEVGAALVLGVTIQRMHRWSDDVVDKYVFRSAHEAELRLKRLGTTLVHAPSGEVIDRIVCGDAARTLALASAAVFHAAEKDGFVRTASCGWPETALHTIPAGHRLALYLATEERPTVPDDAFEAEDMLPGGTAKPALALPFIVRHRLVGFVLYGSHTSGAQPDAKDIELLAEFAGRATAAYDHLAMEDRTNENRELRSDLDSLRAQNDLLKSMIVETGAAR